ncbi:MAG: UDP-2,3-diacylglucosamine diphosphatase LpxI [Alphaproteobacteria bacterium]|nr:UDP-2,3-diacylglucosamine diphosphatase LpxI [Alphaproteobacteria bacterium]
MSAVPSLAIVAGGGEFPDMVAAEATKRGTRVFAVRLANDAEAHTLQGYEGIWAKPERMGAIFETLRANGVADIVLIGRMKRPRLFSLRPDFTTLRLLPKIIPALCFGGDDELLRRVRAVLENEGFRLHGAHEYLDTLLVTEGALGRVVPDATYIADIAVGAEAARRHGARDEGQAVIVCGGQVVAEEDVAGTDALIERHGQKGAVLVKTAKPQQDRALDMPAIGINTIKACAAKGMAGIAIEAGATLVGDKKATIDLADRLGLFVVGIK